ncbi:hypothetical protein KSP39_PZI004277 [Platanthera zijinensis]|uniref:Uncharacterized protein n=1 Tax=Platanthera zijinensis TaxID=2320716 RepID=A0AAP0BWT1_9ASPA
MFSQVVATGEDSWAPSIGTLPPDVGRIHLEDDVADNTENIGSASTSAVKRRKFGKNKGVALSLMSDLHQSTLSLKPPSVISVKEVIQLIAGSPEIRANPDLYYFALDHIRDKTTRKILMSIPEEDRVWWIKQAYERRAH